MKIMERGQITIPKKYRELYGITRETEITFIPREEGLMIVKAPPSPSPFQEVFGILRRFSSTDPYIDEIRGQRNDHCD